MNQSMYQSINYSKTLRCKPFSLQVLPGTVNKILTLE